MEFNFNYSDVQTWREFLGSYPTRIASLEKPELDSLNDFYRSQLSPLLRSRLPAPYLTRSEFTTLMQWKLTRGKFRPRLLGFVKSLDEDVVKSATEKAFLALPDLGKVVSELTVLKGVGPATASAVLAAYAPDVAPFMSDEAMEAALGNQKNSYEECKEPPRMQLLDKFDMGGPGSCLKRYSDPAFYRRSSGNSSLNDEKSKKERKARKAKKRRSWKWSTQLSFDAPPFSYNGSVKISSPPRQRQPSPT